MGDFIPKILYCHEAFLVAGEHPDDGYPTAFSYWSDREDAEEDMVIRKRRFPDLDVHVSKTYIYSALSESGRIYYAIPEMKEIVMDPPSVESIKAKLTDAELAVLGITR